MVSALFNMCYAYLYLKSFWNNNKQKTAKICYRSDDGLVTHTQIS